jgi:hypothetical protein
MTNIQLWTGIQPDPAVISNGTDTPLITLQRNECFGDCPVYNAALFEDGTIVYSGIAHVEKIGVYIFQTDTTAVNSIAQQAQILGYFDWQDAYESRTMTDRATVITSIRWEDQSKRIVRYDGDPIAPVGLVWIEKFIDQLVTNVAG